MSRRTRRPPNFSSGAHAGGAGGVSCSGGANGVKLFVFDFDQTLSMVHVFKSLAGWDGQENGRKPWLPPPHATSELGQMRRIQELNGTQAFGPGGFAEAAFGGPDRVEHLRQFLRSLRDRGADLVVCTKGLVGVVQSCLADLGLMELFSDVYGRVGNSYGETNYDKSVAQSKVSSREAQLLGTPDKADWVSKDRLISRLKSRYDLDRRQVVLADDDPDEIKRGKAVCMTLFIREAAGLTSEHFQMLQEAAVDSKDEAPHRSESRLDQLQGAKHHHGGAQNNGGTIPTEAAFVGWDRELPCLRRVPSRPGMGAQQESEWVRPQRPSSRGLSAMPPGGVARGPSMQRPAPSSKQAMEGHLQLAQPHHQHQLASRGALRGSRGTLRTIGGAMML